MRPIAISLVLVAAGVGNAAAQVQPAPGEQGPRIIHVTGQASVQRTPDRAVVQLAVETVAPTAREASAANAATMERVLSAVRGVGIPAARIRTTRIELRPRYDTRRDAREPTIVGYQAVNGVVVQVDDLTRVGQVVDAAVQAGANRVTGIGFQIRDPEEAYHEALRAAIARAGSEARVIAEALGESLGPPIQVSTGRVEPPTRFRMDAVRMEAAVAAPPVEPGELDVHATVSITYRLGQ